MTDISPKKEGKAASIAAGGGVGGFFVFLANSTFNEPWREIATYAAPTLAVFTGWIFDIISKEIKSKIADRSIAKELAKAKKALDAIDQDPKATNAHKEQVRTTYETLERLTIQLHEKRIKASMVEVG